VSERNCPRYRKPFSYVKRRVINGRVYLYAVHHLGYVKEGGRAGKLIRECYLDQKISVSTPQPRMRRRG